MVLFKGRRDDRAKQPGPFATFNLLDLKKDPDR